MRPLQRVALVAALALASVAWANAHGGGGGGGGGGSLDPNVDCMLWALPADAGTDGGADAGPYDGGFVVGATCLQHATLYGCSAAGTGWASAALLGLLAAVARRRRGVLHVQHRRGVENAKGGRRC